VIKRHCGRKVVEAEYAGLFRVIHPHRFAGSARCEHGRDGVLARVSPRIGVDVQEFFQRDLKASFFHGLASSGGFAAFPFVLVAAWERPSERGISSLD